MIRVYISISLSKIKYKTIKQVKYSNKEENKSNGKEGTI